MFHRHLDDYVHHSHGGPGPHALRTRAVSRLALARAQCGGRRAACSTAASSIRDSRVHRRKAPLQL